MNVNPYIRNGTLVWTMTTNGYKFITLNLIRSLEQIKVPWRLLVVACDKDSYTFFRNEGLPVVQYPNAQRTNETSISRWGSPSFQRYNFMKLFIANEFAKNEAIQQCIYIDGDIVVFRDFVPDIVERLEAQPEQVLFQCDEKAPGQCNDTGCLACCTGFIAWKHGADKGVFSVGDRNRWNEHADDQFWVNRFLREEKLSYRTLPRELYPNGAYIDTFPSLKEPFLLHFNHRVGNAKIVEIKKLKLWFIPY
jgi:hypothetical protein